MLIVIVLNGFYGVFMELALFLPCRKIPAAGFPGKLLCYDLVFTVLQHPRMFGIGILCIRILLSIVLSKQFNSSLDSVQSTKNLLFILRIYFPYF